MTAVADLAGATLALWVARAEGVDAVMSDDGSDCLTFYSRGHDGCMHGRDFSPHAHWSDGGPIVARANIQLSPPTSPVHRCGGPNAGNGQSGCWSACTWTRGIDGRRAFGWDKDSALVAAMRCFVRSVYGDTVVDVAANPKGGA